MILSIRLMTYNHAAFINDALQGINIQNTNFDVEVVVGDDFSSDDTLQKIKNFKFTNPNLKIKILDRKQGDTYSVQRKKKGRLYNFIDIINNCQGKYIALLDGDDYWTDPLKLQKQVEFLEANLEYVLCFHKVNILMQEEGGKIIDDFITEPRYNKITKFPIDIYSLQQHSNFIHTPSVVFRNCINSIPLEMSYSPVGDFLLYFILAQKGYFFRIDEVMGVYRYGEGVFSKLSENEKNIIGKKFEISLLSYTDNEEIKKSLIESLFKFVDGTKKKEIKPIGSYTFGQLINILFIRLKKRFICFFNSLTNKSTTLKSK